MLASHTYGLTYVFARALGTASEARYCYNCRKSQVLKKINAKTALFLPRFGSFLLQNDTAGPKVKGTCQDVDLDLESKWRLLNISVSSQQNRLALPILLKKAVKQLL